MTGISGAIRSSARASESTPFSFTSRIAPSSFSDRASCCACSSRPTGPATLPARSSTRRLSSSAARKSSSTTMIVRPSRDTGIVLFLDTRVARNVSRLGKRELDQAFDAIGMKGQVRRAPEDVGQTLLDHARAEALLRSGVPQLEAALPPAQPEMRFGVPLSGVPFDLDMSRVDRQGAVLHRIRGQLMDGHRHGLGVARRKPDCRPAQGEIGALLPAAGFQLEAHEIDQLHHLQRPAYQEVLSARERAKARLERFDELVQRTAPLARLRRDRALFRMFFTRC